MKRDGIEIFFIDWFMILWYKLEFFFFFLRKIIMLMLNLLIKNVLGVLMFLYKL